VVSPGALDTVPAAVSSVESVPRRLPRRTAVGVGVGVGVGVTVLGLAAVSLLWTREPTYDPWAWIIWSREIAHGNLSTTTGPSWKPLPVLLTTPFAALNAGLAPLAWLVLARAGGLLALLFSYRLGARLAGPWAGAIAAGALLLSDGFVRDAARGNSEGMLIALALAAVLVHLAGGRKSTFLLLLAAGLLRPELWLALALYGGYLLLRVPGSRVLVALSAVAVLTLWFVPEYIGSGNALRASDRAREVNPGSAALATVPFFEVLRRSTSVLLLPVLAGAGAGLWFAVRSRDRLALLLAGLAAACLLVVGAMTQAGYAGNLRYVALPAALLCPLAGAGWVALARRVPAVALLAGVLALPLLLPGVRGLADQLRLTRAEARLYGNLDQAIALAGGRDALRACGQILTGPFDTTALVARLGVAIDDVTIFPDGNGTVLAPSPSAPTATDPLQLWLDPSYPLVGTTDQWVIRARCS